MADQERQHEDVRPERRHSYPDEPVERPCPRPGQPVFSSACAVARGPAELSTADGPVERGRDDLWHRRQPGCCRPEVSKRRSYRGRGPGSDRDEARRLPVLSHELTRRRTSYTPATPW